MSIVILLDQLLLEFFCTLVVKQINECSFNSLSLQVNGSWHAASRPPSVTSLIEGSASAHSNTDTSNWPVQPQHSVIMELSSLDPVEPIDTGHFKTGVLWMDQRTLLKLHWLSRLIYTLDEGLRWGVSFDSK